MVLATDRIQTVAVFIYDDVQWGDQFTQIGFNLGDGATHFTLSESRSNLSTTVDELSNIGHPGVFVYRIDRK